MITVEFWYRISLIVIFFFNSFAFISSAFAQMAGFILIDNELKFLVDKGNRDSKMMTIFGLDSNDSSTSDGRQPIKLIASNLIDENSGKMLDSRNIIFF